MGNREIKFRAFDPNSGQMHVAMTLQQMRQVIVKSASGEAGSLGVIFSVTFDDLIFMQYTGLKDKHNNEIYDQDIIRDHSGYKWVVSWFEDNACFGIISVENKRTIDIIDNVNTEVIGNKFQTPELCH